MQNSIFEYSTDRIFEYSVWIFSNNSRTHLQLPLNYALWAIRFHAAVYQNIMHKNSLAYLYYLNELAKNADDNFANRIKHHIRMKLNQRQVSPSKT